MHELDRIRAALADAAARGESVVLATVEQVDGSVYRGVGARMVVRQDGRTVGAVSGGCLEADIVARAPALLDGGVPETVRYDTRSSDDVVLGLGLGCRGVIELRLEPLRGAGLANAIAEIGGLRDRQSVRLLVCGAGTDAQPVVQLAAAVGWLPIVVDHRPAFATRDRFPAAEQVLCANAATDEGALAAVVPLHTIGAAVVMAHAATHDRAYLHALLRVRALRYIGVLGPLQRTRELLEGAPGTTPGTMPPNLYAPVGLDLGAETSEEIALSVVGEVAAVLAGRRGGSLRERGGPIHVDRLRGAAPAGVEP